MKHSKIFLLVIITLIVCINVNCGSENRKEKIRNPSVITISTKMEVPAWALKERELFDLNKKIVELFAQEFILPNGYINVDYKHGGGVVAPDDVSESIFKVPLLYSLGADESMWDLWWRYWNGSIKQSMEHGLFVNEFNKYLDWHHNGEQYEGFWLAGLCKPDDQEYIRQSLKFAGFYDGTNSDVPNYDPEKKIIKSILHGGSGPILNPTLEDWGGGAFWTRWLECAHDGPVNLVLTCFGTNAYLLSGDEHHRRVVLEYIDAWQERAKKNNGVIPSIVLQDGTVPKEWWGGVMGWNFTPFGGLFQVTSGPRAALWNALLLTGDKSYFDPLRALVDTLWNNRTSVETNGVIQQNCIPRYYGKQEILPTDPKQRYQNPQYTGKEGWYGHSTDPIHSQRKYDEGGISGSFGVYPSMLANLYIATMREDDKNRLLDRVPPGATPESLTAGHRDDQEGGYERDWVKWLDGDNDGWPERELDRCINNTKKQIETYEKEIGISQTKDNPAQYFKDLIAHKLHQHTLDVGWAGPLVNLMTGSIMPLWHGQLLFSRFRYFDPERKRPGIPEDCAAMVDSMTDNTATLVLINLNNKEKRTILVQTGAYAEHKCLSVEKEDESAVKVNGTSFIVELKPGCGQRLTVRMDRFVNKPTLSLPW